MQQNTVRPNDEIDIFEFSSRMWAAFTNFLVGIKDLIVSIIIFLIRKSLWIVSFALIGAILGVVLHRVSRPYYSSSLEGTTGGIENSVVIDHINKLNLVTSKPDLLANYLGINVEDAKAIHSIKAFYGIDINKDWKVDYVDFKNTYNPKDTNQIRVPSFIHVKVSVYDENILPVLRKGLFQYIKTNTYVQELFKIDTFQKRQFIKELESEIYKIDSLQRAKIRKELMPDKGNTLVLDNRQEFRLFHEDILSLYARKQRLEKELDISDEIIIIVQDFTPLQLEEPVFKYVTLFGGSMAILGIFCALLWQYRKRIWELIREDSTK